MASIGNKHAQSGTNSPSLGLYPCPQFPDYLQVESLYLTSGNLMSVSRGLGLPRCHGGKESTCQCRRRRRGGFDPGVGKMPLEEEMMTHFIVLAWEKPGSPWGHKELDTHTHK